MNQIKIAFFESAPPFGDRIGGIPTYILHRAHILSKNGYTVYWTDGLKIALFNFDKKEWGIIKEFTADKFFRIKKRYPQRLQGIVYLLNEIRIDIIEFPDSYGYDIKKLKNKCKVIIQCHTSSPLRDSLNNLPLSLRAKLNAKRIRNNFFSADKIIACSFEIALLTSGFYKVHLDKFNVIPHAFSPDLSYLILNQNNKRGDYFLAIANVEYFKSIDLLLNAFLEYKRKGGKNKLYYIGPKDLSDTTILMKKRWKELGTVTLIEKINKTDFEFVPYLKKDKVLGLMSKAKATIVLSRFEAFTMVVGEAASVGCPLIISNRTGWNNLINRFDAGLFVNPYNSDEVATAMIEIEKTDVEKRFTNNIKILNDYLCSKQMINATINQYTF